MRLSDSEHYKEAISWLEAIANKKRPENPENAIAAASLALAEQVE